MNYIKSIWTSNPTTSDSSSQQQNFNTVTFTPTSGNSFVITTTNEAPQQRPQQLIFHTNSSSLRPEMTVSPTDSFHSTSSTFDQPNENSKGKTNRGYTSSSTDMNISAVHMQSHQHNQVVHREQYWTWQWPFKTFWDSWNNREKIFLIVIVSLSVCILVLLSILSVVLTRNQQLKEFIITKLGNNTNSLL